MSEKRCETCKYWVRARSNDKGSCLWEPPALPICMTLEFRRTRAGEGFECPCWEEKK